MSAIFDESRRNLPHRLYHAFNAGLSPPPAGSADAVRPPVLVRGIPQQRPALQHDRLRRPGGPISLRRRRRRPEARPSRPHRQARPAGHRGVGHHPPHPPAEAGGAAEVPRGARRRPDAPAAAPEQGAPQEEVRRRRGGAVAAADVGRDLAGREGFEGRVGAQGFFAKDDEGSAQGRPWP